MSKVIIFTDGELFLKELKAEGESLKHFDRTSYETPRSRIQAGKNRKSYDGMITFGVNFAGVGSQ